MARTKSKETMKIGHLYQVDGNQVSRFVHAFGNEVAFAEGQAASDGGACAEVGVLARMLVGGV